MWEEQPILGNCYRSKDRRLNTNMRLSQISLNALLALLLTIGTAGLATATPHMKSSANPAPTDPMAPAVHPIVAAQSCSCPSNQMLTPPTGCNCVFVFAITRFDGVCTDLPSCSQVAGCRIKGSTGWRCGGTLGALTAYDVSVGCPGTIAVVDSCPPGQGTGVGEIKLLCDNCTP